MEYSALRLTETASMECSAGDALRGELAHEKGSVRVVIGQNGTEPGVYQISVTGDRACGAASFTSVPAERGGENPTEIQTEECPA